MMNNLDQPGHHDLSSQEMQRIISFFEVFIKIDQREKRQQEIHTNKEEAGNEF